MDEIFITILVFVFIGAIFIFLGIPLLMEKVKPNWFYGFRTPTVVKNKDLWYKVNKQVGREFIIAGIILMIGSIFILIFQPILSIIQLIIILLMLIQLSLIFIIIRGFLLLRRLKNDN
jgi:uncharacterized membrane protein